MRRCAHAPVRLRHRLAPLCACACARGCSVPGRVRVRAARRRVGEGGGRRGRGMGGPEVTDAPPGPFDRFAIFSSFCCFALSRTCRCKQPNLPIAAERSGVRNTVRVEAALQGRTLVRTYVPCRCSCWRQSCPFPSSHRRMSPKAKHIPAELSPIPACAFPLAHSRSRIPACTKQDAAACATHPPPRP